MYGISRRRIGHFLNCLISLALLCVYKLQTEQLQVCSLLLLLLPSDSVKTGEAKQNTHYGSLQRSIVHVAKGIIRLGPL